MKTTTVIFFSKYFAFCIAAIIAFFIPIHNILVGIGALIVADMITGIFAARKRGEKIHSKKMGATVTKTILYFLGIILAQIMQNLFLDPGVESIVKATASIFAVIEFKSNLENISTATGIDLIGKLKTFIETKRKIDD